ncbi:MAG: ABC transporter ATP-binding protein [Chitinophagaceae bacterium]
MSIILSVENLVKSYGSVRALNGVSFDVPQGSVFGILGPNGSGKTTLLGIVMNVLRAGAGQFSWFGKPGGSSDQRKKIGSLLETPNFYGYLSGTENLKITHSISGRGNRAQIDEVLKKVNLYDRRWASFKSFSLGMKQRLAIAAALLGNPQVLVLDEPTNGLDPVGIAEIRQLIVELRENGHTIIMASHLLDEVEKVCTHAAILKNGQLITSGNVEDILMDDDIVELSAADLEALANLFRGTGREVRSDDKTKTLHVIFPRGTAKMEEINRFCFDHGIVLTRLVQQKKRLEARFFELTNN